MDSKFEERKKENRGMVSVPSFMGDGSKYSVYGETVNQEKTNSRTKEKRSSPNKKEKTYAHPVRNPIPANTVRQKKRRRVKIIKRSVLGIFFVLFILAGHLVAKMQVGVFSVLNTMNRGAVDLDHVDVNRNNLKSDAKVTNILLVGADKRESWKEAGRSDSVMIATLDGKNKKLKLTSLMRDLYVTIPEHGENKFNAAYSFGGISLLYQTIAVNFGLHLDAYVVVDFAAFKTVINKIGGVDIELTKEEAYYLTTAYKKGSVLKLKEGMNKMNGEQALAYTRIRQDTKGDFGRTERQRNVMQALFTEAKSMSISEVEDLAREILPNITTDLSNDQIFSYLMKVITMGTTKIDNFRIPVDDTYTQKRIRKMAVLVPDLEVNKNALYDFIYE